MDAFVRYYTKSFWDAISIPLPSNMDMPIPEACRNCPNHPSNGGSGICHCILGGLNVTY